ncbi:MAG: MnhB domain-containing protein [Candidatus Rokuibacteriota bacterium]
MIGGHDSVIVQTTVRLLLPWIRIFGLYVLFHGHSSPGGGFQGGVMFAASYIVIGLALGRRELERCAPERATLQWAAVGALVFFGVGVAALAGGGGFLDYGSLPLPTPDGPALRAFGVLLIEIGVFLAVTASLTLIFVRLAKVAEDERA